MPTHKEVAEKLLDKLKSVHSKIIGMARSFPPYDVSEGPLLSVPLSYTVLGITWGCVGLVQKHLRVMLGQDGIEKEKVHVVLDCAVDVAKASKLLEEARDLLDGVAHKLDAGVYVSLPIMAMSLEAGDRAMRFAMKELNDHLEKGLPRPAADAPAPEFPQDIEASLRLLMAIQQAKCRGGAPGHEDCVRKGINHDLS